MTLVEYLNFVEYDRSVKIKFNNKFEIYLYYQLLEKHAGIDRYQNKYSIYSHEKLYETLRWNEDLLWYRKFDEKYPKCFTVDARGGEDKYINFADILKEINEIIKNEKQSKFAYEDMPF